MINVILNSEDMKHFVGASEAFALSEGLTNGKCPPPVRLSLSEGLTNGQL